MSYFKEPVDVFGTLRRNSLSHFIALALAISFFWSVPYRAQAAPGELDPEFGAGGKVISNTSKTFKFIRAVAIQHKNKIIVAGDSSGRSGQQAFIGQYKEDGTPDSGFGVSGFVDVNFGPGVATAIAIQPDRKIVVAGTAGPDFGLARFNKDGSPDSSFGVGGLVTRVFFGAFDQAYGFALGLQRDGRIIVAGEVRKGSQYRFALARFNADGSLDPAFGGDGKVSIDLSTNLSQALAVAVQPDGKIVAAGLTSNGDTKNDFAIVRLNIDGSLDRGFGVRGKVTTDFSGGFDYAHAVLIQPDGRIIAVGEADFHSALARYDSDGKLDPNFGSAGKTTGNGSSAVAAILQEDGKIVVAGREFDLTRYNADGTLDSSFGIDGNIRVNFFPYSAMGTSVALQKNGRIIIAGAATTTSLRYSLAMARLLAK